MKVTCSINGNDINESEIEKYKAMNDTIKKSCELALKRLKHSRLDNRSVET